MTFCDVSEVGFLNKSTNQEEKRKNEGNVKMCSLYKQVYHHRRTGTI